MASEKKRCRACRLEYAVNRDGLVRSHGDYYDESTRSTDRCPGSRRPPLGDPDIGGDPVFYCLITDASGGPDGRGNLGDTGLTTDGKDVFVGLPLHDWITEMDCRVRASDPRETRPVSLRRFGVLAEVFCPLEILIVNKSGREVAGQQREPSQWLVGYETYRDVGHAIDRAAALGGLGRGEPWPERRHEVVNEMKMEDLVEMRGAARECEEVVHAD